MRLNLTQPSAKGHSEIAAAVGWNAFSELFSCSDDHSICRWSSRGDLEGKVCVIESASFTDLQWLPAGARKGAGGADLFAVACTDGTFKFVTRTGKVEKSVDAHQGGVLSLRWSYDGSALATAGEDGQVKVWSRSGMLRSTLAQADGPVHCIAWGQDGDSLAYCSGGSVAVKPLQGGGGSGGAAAGAPGAGGGGSGGGAPRATAGVAWRAHDGVVLALDWSPVSGLIVTGGEDCRYKVWDSYGRLLYASAPFDHAVTSVAWSPGGEAFAAGAFNTIALCDRMGWVHAKARAQVGSLLGLAWSPDGTQLAGCGGGGGIVLGRLVDIRLEDRRVHALLQDERSIAVHDILEGTQELLEFRDPVVRVSLGYGHLVAATAGQCHIYSVSNFNTPHIFDLVAPLSLLLQCERSLLLCDAAAGMQIVTYEGRVVCSPRAAGMRPELLSPRMVSLSPDTLAALDAPGGSSVRVFDTAQGRQQGEPIAHGVEIQQVALSQAGTASERLLAVVDRNRDLTLIHVGRRAAAKLASNVDAAAWHDVCPMLAAVVDGRLMVWHHPGVAFVDAGLLDDTRTVRGDSNFGPGAQVASFFGGKVLVARPDGATLAAWAPPHPAMLHELLRRARWGKAARLCRCVGEPSLWAVLAAAAMAAGELAAAEAAFAALGAADKLAYVRRAAALPGGAARGAELTLYRRQPAEAEALLLQAGLVYRAIKLHIRLHNWPRALELAQKHGRHVATVLLARRRDLARHGRPPGDEPIEALRRAAAGVEVDEAAVARDVAEDKRAEREGRGGGGAVGQPRCGGAPGELAA
ncbi:MAG: intraflagellar transport protein 80 [Monoraphidium minutum]|nr:MAG: intraflagellar transport protein 80 [Monoraphidium minutum]